MAQRVSSASVSVGGEVVGAIAEPGLLLLVGITHTDDASVVDRMAEKVWQLRPLFDAFVEALRRRGAEVATGRFGEMMAVSLVNDGPVTLILDSEG